MSTEEVAQSLSPEIQEKLGIAKQKKEEALEKENELKQMLLSRKDRPSKGNTSLDS